MDIDTAIQRTIEQARATLSQATAKAYRTGLRCFLRFLETQNIHGSSPIEEINMEHFIRFPLWLLSEEDQNGKPYRRGSTRVYVSGAKEFLNWLTANDMIETTYKDTIRYNQSVKLVNRKRESKLPRTPEPKDVDKILQAARTSPLPSPIKERNIALVEFLHSTGCRINEAVTLNIGDIDIENKCAKVTGKGSKERIVFLNQATIDALLEYWRIRKTGTYSTYPVFSRHDCASKKKLKNITTETGRNVVRQLCDLAGVNRGSFTPHRFRHHFASVLLRETGNLALVQDAMGHTDPKATRVYAKINQTEIQEAHGKVFE